MLQNLGRASIQVALLVCLFETAAHAQGERATISGTVTDSTQAVVAGASVTVRNVDTNVTNHAQSNTSGIFVIPALPPGTYELTGKPGFRAFKLSGIPLSVGLTASVDVRLELGQVTEAVQVTASAVQLETQTSGMGETVTTRVVSELPLLGRDPRQLSALAPGVIPTRGRSAGDSTIGYAGNSRIAGGLAQQNAILMDGGDTRRIHFRRPVLRLSPRVGSRIQDPDCNVFRRVRPRGWRCDQCGVKIRHQ